MSLFSGPVDFSKPLDRSHLSGKTAFVTGGASGIGEATVRALAEAGANVTIADRNAEAGKAYADKLVGEGYQTNFVHTDVTEWTSQVSAFKHAIEHSPTKTIDIVIACAGIAGPSILQDAPFTAEDSSADPTPPNFHLSMINVNLVGPMYTSTLAIHYWRQQQKSSAFSKRDNVLIIIASNIAYFSSASFTGYTASKMGVRGFWKSLRDTQSLADLFRTNLLAPHLVRSPMTLGLQSICDKAGIKLTDISDCVDALMRFCCDSDIRGRAVQVNPEGSTFDLFDDLENHDGSKAFLEHHEKETKPVFDMVNNPNLSMN